MGNYLDQTYAACQGVILAYQGNSVSLQIPRTLGNMEIHAIGDGAAMESKELQQVVIPAGVQRIGSKSFYKCAELRHVYLPSSVTSVGSDSFAQCFKLVNLHLYGMELNEREYQSLLSSCVRVNGSMFLSLSFPTDQRLKDLVDAAGVKPANPLPHDFRRLFVSQSLMEEKGVSSLKRNLETYGVGSKEKYLTELSEAERTIAAGIEAERDAAAEEQNDRFMKAEKYPSIERTALFLVDDAETKRLNGKRIVSAVIKLGYHFIPAETRLAVQDVDYCIYSRHYLTAERNLSYIRRDVAVFRSGHLVNDRKEAQEVYAKYKLPAIL